MKRWQVQSGFGVENLVWSEGDPGDPGPGEVVLRVRAVSLNYRDLLMIHGHYNPRQPLPLVPGSDCVGEVVAVGDGVTEWTAGQRVCPAFNPGWLDGPIPHTATRTTLGGPVDGVFQETVVVPASALVSPPEHWTDAECATLPCAGVTAWRALVSEAQIGPGSTVLTLGTGGVSLFALQIARMKGARVCITSSSDQKLARAKAMGASEGISYTTDADWGRTARRWAGSGVDVVVELGGAGTLEQSLRAVRTGGTVALIGVLAGVKTSLALTSVLMRHVRVQGVFVGSVRDLADLVACYRSHPDQRPAVDRVFELAELPQALQWMAEGRHMGKVVLQA
ncbi:MAG TPA: NAD(P)-dependent alcohol dehydrogenase [Deltaproteobacteria bacterium]|nr:NAD(P)-dependent alcohol dehydrogenase [Deltaproteobacteria bacterium]